MKKTLLVILTALLVSVNAQNVEVSGNQSGIWDCDTVFVVGNVTVPRDNSLTIETGTTVLFNDYYGIEVFGELLALGSEDEPITFTVSDTTGFYMDTIGNGGWAGIHFKKSDNVVLNYCNFNYGKAINQSSGGAVHFFGCDNAIVNRCNFNHNLASFKGGAVYAEMSKLTMSHCEVADNDGYSSDLGAYLWGGGMYFLKCDVNLNDLYVHDNYCPSCYGGGMSFDSCNLVLDKAVIEDNYSTNAGGIGVQRCNDYDVRIYNVLLDNNIAYHYGGGMCFFESHPTLDNVTFAYNYTMRAGGGAMQFYSASPTFRNCIIYGNDWYDEVIQHGSQIFVWNPDANPNFYNCDIEHGLEDIHNFNYINEYVDNIDIDPMFADTVLRDFSLRAGSPCINAGTVDTTGFLLPSTDLVGGPRVYDNRIDIGAYEFNNISVNEIVVKDNNVTVYPNPLTMNSLCRFSLEESTEVILNVYSSKGALIYQKILGAMESGEHSVSLSDFVSENAGGNLYIIEIKTSGKSYFSKAVY